MQTTLLTLSTENSQTLSQSFYRRLWVWYNSGVTGHSCLSIQSPFTQNRDSRSLKEPTLSRHTLQLTTEVKYLGLFLDKGLTWKA
jgi:hypothetical protein